MKREWYMTEDEFLEVVTQAYKHRWSNDMVKTGSMHPTDHAANFMTFVETFAASLEALSDFVQRRADNEEA